MRPAKSPPPDPQAVGMTWQGPRSGPLPCHLHPTTSWPTITPPSWLGFAPALTHLAQCQTLRGLRAGLAGLWQPLRPWAWRWNGAGGPGPVRGCSGCGWYTPTAIAGDGVTLRDVGGDDRPRSAPARMSGAAVDQRDAVEMVFGRAAALAMRGQGGWS